ncbi:DNA-binding GntR family transcriptional regulator [Thermocatellispora tengchongensis]|uniref:DNA-binding GntR family transcriptional regulator n=1 Tax=Thermocatellispora tengchongensis TaxID=1073253 RepID=A0A840PKH4_9ACTN|nr:GntR family transcriptional regulator [Thermocatellispora tengchongensis]MBB5138413.1 DNA-binding GntR family transcriptional regulator [Thermocatellispora tengchongensis]
MNASPLPFIDRPENLTDRVLRAIRDSIVDRTLSPGSRVSEAQVAAMLNVSKTPVREALLRLKHVGLVEPCERGLQVVRPSVGAIRDAYEFRAGLERTSSWYAANRADSRERERLVHLARQSLKAAEAHEAAAFRRHDRDFHHTIAAASRNAVLAQSIDDALVLTSVLRERDVPASQDSVSCAHEHVSIAQAVLAGQAERAAQLMSDHVLHVMSIVLAAHTNAEPETSA